MIKTSLILTLHTVLTSNVSKINYQTSKPFMVIVKNRKNECHCTNNDNLLVIKTNVTLYSTMRIQVKYNDRNLNEHAMRKFNQ